MKQVWKALYGAARKATTSDQRQRAIRKITQNKRRQLIKRLPRGVSQREQQGHRRYIKRKIRNLALRYREKDNFIRSVSPLILARKYRDSIILDSVIPNRENIWINPMERNYGEPPKEISLENFSFFENANETMKMLQEIAEADCRRGSARINFEDEYCTDVAPYLVLSEMWKDMTPIFSGGGITSPVAKVLSKLGLQKALDISFPNLTDADDVWAFPLQRRRPRDTTMSSTRHLDPQRREMVCDLLCEAVDEWLYLADSNQQLTSAGRAWLSQIIGELLDNAERHSAPATKDGDWSIAAFMAKRHAPTSGEFVYRCYLGFLSTGSTIAESISTCASEIRENLDEYVTLHSSHSKQSPDCLRTVYSLQDGITRDATAAAAGRGGTGFQDVFDFVYTLGGTTRLENSPKITILSGRTCIEIPSPHNIGKREAGNRERRVIWFNPQNDPRFAPDSNYVRQVDIPFPGTVISVAFTLDAEYLKGVANDQN